VAPRAVVPMEEEEEGDDEDDLIYKIFVLIEAINGTSRLTLAIRVNNTAFCHMIDRTFREILQWTHFEQLNTFFFVFYSKFPTLLWVVIATRYELDGPGIQSRWGWDFPHPSRPVLGPIQNPIQWVSVLFPRIKRPGRGVDHPLPLNAEVKERVELYLYFPSGLSWPILGQHLALHSNFVFRKRRVSAVFLRK
jgi:hypothetical protein